MKLPPFLSNEEVRIKVLKSYQILDTDSDARFDNLTLLAKQICETEIALISLIDENRQWFKSCIGLDAKQTSRGISFCGHAISSEEDVFEIKDTTKDKRFFDNPLVIGSPHIKFYAGAKIVDKKGYSLGTLCVIDKKPKELTLLQKKSLISLANQVFQLFELHSSNLILENERHKFKRFADLSPNIVYRYSSNSKLIYHSSAITNILGYNPKKFSKNPDLWIELIHKDDLAEVKDSLNKAKIGQRIDIKYRMKSKQNGWRWIHDISTYIQLDETDFVIDGVAIDITESKKYQASIEELNRRYDTAMKASNDAIWEYDSKRDSLFISSHFFEWIKQNQKNQQISIAEFRNNIHPLDISKFNHFIESLKSLKFKSLDIDIRIHIDQDKYKWYNFKGSVIDNYNLLLAGSITDIHLRKINEQELLNAQSLLSQASNIAKFGAWELDIETNNVKWSDGIYEIFEIDNEQRANFNLNEALNFYEKNEREKLLKSLENAIENDSGYDIFLKIITHNGSQKWVRSIARTEYSTNERKRKVLGVIQDVTSEMIGKEKQNKLIEITKNQNNRLKNFAYIVSHNLRSHAANFSSLLDLLQIENGTIDENEIVSMLKKSSKNLLQTIEDLSKVAKMYDGHITDFTKVDLNQIINQVLENLSCLILEKRIKVKSDLNQQIYVKGLASYVESILFNLISNAVKYSDDAKEKQVSITVEETKKHAKITIEDNGLGIDLKKHEKQLFQMYKIFHPHLKGKGLGLFITKNQIEAIGGSIQVSSKPEIGTKFIIHLKKYNNV